MTLFIGNLAFSITQDDLTETFAEFGTVKSVKLPIDWETGRMRGFAFIDLASDAEEETAIASKSLISPYSTPSFYLP